MPPLLSDWYILKYGWNSELLILLLSNDYWTHQCWGMIIYVLIWLFYSFHCLLPELAVRYPTMNVKYTVKPEVIATTGGMGWCFWERNNKYFCLLVIEFFLIEFIPYLNLENISVYPNSEWGFKPFSIPHPVAIVRGRSQRTWVGDFLSDLAK